MVTKRKIFNTSNWSKEKENKLDGSSLYYERSMIPIAKFPNQADYWSTIVFNLQATESILPVTKDNL